MAPSLASSFVRISAYMTYIHGYESRSRVYLLCSMWVYDKTRRTNKPCAPPPPVMCIKSQYHMSRNGHVVTSEIPMFCHQHDLQYGTVSFIRIFISYILSWEKTHTIHHVTDKNSVFVDHSVYYKSMKTVVHVLWNLALSGLNHWMPICIHVCVSN